MEQIIQILNGVSPDLKYYVLGLGIAIAVIIIAVAYTKWEAHAATTAYKKRKDFKLE